MKILGKNVSRKFQSFYKEIKPRINVPIIFEKNPYKAMGDFRLENGTAKIRLDDKLIKSHFEETAAHELIHALEEIEYWPNTAIPGNLPPNSPEAAVGRELGACVRDLHVYDTLKILGFGANYSNETRYNNTNRELAVATVPSIGSPMYCLWIIRYCLLAMTQPTNRWLKIQKIYQKRTPAIAEKGEELITIIKNNGWSNPEQALSSMIAIRNSLGIKSNQIMIFDNRTKNYY